MQNRFRTLRLSILALCALSLSCAAGAATLKQIKDRGSVRIAIANEIPYGYANLDGEAQGVGPDVAKQVMQRLGITKVEWSVTSFSSLIPGLKAQRYDMVAAEMAILPQRCRQVLFSEPNSSYGEGLLVAKGNPDNRHSFEEFAKGEGKIAVMAGADQLDMLHALHVPQGNIVTIASNADAISTVSTGRASAYAATSLTVNQLAKKSPRVEAAALFTDPVIQGQPARSWGGFAFAKNSDSFQKAFNAELAKFKHTQAWRDILARYGFSEADMKASFDRGTKQLCAKQNG